MSSLPPPRPVAANPDPSFLSENPVIASIMYAMKITFIFILVLFIDSVQRVYRVQLELAIATEKIAKGGYVTLFAVKSMLGEKEIY